MLVDGLRSNAWVEFVRKGESMMKSRKMPILHPIPNLGTRYQFGPLRVLEPYLLWPLRGWFCCWYMRGKYSSLDRPPETTGAHCGQSNESTCL